MRNTLLALATAVVAGTVATVAFSSGGTKAPVRPDVHFAKAPGTAEETHRSVGVDGGRWTTKSFRNPTGQFCLSQTVPGEGVGISCTERRNLFAGREIYVIKGARQESSGERETQWANLWLQGVVSPRVASLELVSVECAVEQIPVDGSRVFMHVVGRASIERGDVPYKLVARDAGGAVVAEENVAVGLSDHGKAAGLTAPKPRAACA